MQLGHSGQVFGYDPWNLNAQRARVRIAVGRRYLGAARGTTMSHVRNWWQFRDRFLVNRDITTTEQGSTLTLLRPPICRRNGTYIVSNHLVGLYGTGSVALEGGFWMDG